MAKIQDNFIDSCISDFPYWLEFMGKSWDKGIPYEWCLPRAKELLRIIKPGGYCLIFGHPKTNHRMKCAFEDAGFQIVEEIDWIYFTGFPKNQDIGKMFDKKAGAERKIIGYSERNDRALPNGEGGTHGSLHNKYQTDGRESTRLAITRPSTELAQKWNGWKTAGLKPAKESITVFQKPLEGTYCDNIEKWNCGGMNIDACRIETTDNLNGGAYSGGQRCDGEWKENSGFKNNKLTGEYKQPIGRFPPNIIFDEETGKLLDEQTGITKSSGGSGDKSKGALGKSIYGKYENEELATHAGGLGDMGGGSRFFYCAKPSSKEKTFLDGTKNTHVTVKPISLYKWLIKLVTPKDGITIDITAGSCTHGVACEELNKEDGYNLKWCDIEIDQDNKGNDAGYIEIGKKRLENAIW